MTPRLIPLLLLGLIGLPAAAGGWEFGEYGKPGLVRCGKFQICQAARSLNGRFAVQSVRWVGRDGGSTGRRVSVDLLDAPAFLAPAGQWVGLVLVLDGPVVLWGENNDGTSFDYALDLNELYVPLDTIARRGDGVQVSLPADIGSLAADELEVLLRDGAWGWVE